MELNNYIEFLTQYSLATKLHIKFLLLLLIFYFSLVFFSSIFDIINLFNKKDTLKKRLLDQESNLINLKKKYLDGKINAREYKINTIEILNSKK